MKLLYARRSPYARKARIMILEKHLAVEMIEEDLARKTSALLEASPLAKVPLLILNDGDTLYDSPVICEYLDSLGNEPILIPKDPEQRWHVKRWEALADGMMDCAITCYMEKTRHPQDFHEKLVRVQEETIVRCLEYFDKHISELKALSLASIAVACAIGYTQFRLPHLTHHEKLMNLSRWYAEFSLRPSFAGTIPTA